VSIDGQMSEPAYNRTVRAFNESGSSHGERHKIKLLEGGAKFAAMQMNPEDVQMIESRKFSVEEIARLYRMSPHLLQDLTHGTFSNITELGRQFIIFTMMPWFKRWEAEINRKILTPPFEAKFNAKAFLEGDHTARMEMHKAMFGMGRTLNEILEIEGENPIGAEGDVRFVPVNMQPIDLAINPPEPPAPVVPPPPPPPEPGETEEDPQEPPQESENEPEQQAATPDAVSLEAAEEAAEACLSEAVGRMNRKEARAAERASRRPDGWVDFLDTFHAKHEKTVCDAILPAVRTLLVVQGDIVSVEDRVAEIATELISRHHEELLDAADCKPIDLPQRVADVTRGWRIHG